MIMIPPLINNDNYAEKKVFFKLRDNPNPKTKDWLVYHSLNYPVSISKRNRKSFKYFGEADFVIVVPNKGIINIEVKGWHGVSSVNGVWKILKPNGTEIIKKKGPIQQARQSMHDIKDYIKLKIDKNFPQSWMLIFTQCHFNADDNIEYSSENIVVTDGLDKNFNDKILYLANILKTGGGRFQITEQDLKIIKNKIMRPNFEILIKTSTILKNSEKELHEYTKEQLEIFDWINNHPRILVTGTQGTGKTAVAEEIIKRELQNSEVKKILFLNSNRLPNEEMIYKLKNIENFNKVTCNTFYKFITNLYSDIDPGDSINIDSIPFLKKHDIILNECVNFLKNEKNLRDYKFGTGIDFEKKYKFDLIVFDEMQNCYFYNKFYELLNLLLKKGLTDGKFCFLGDFDNQNLVSSNSDAAKEKHPENNLLDIKSILLYKNVRNAKSISRNAPILSGLFKESFPYKLGKSELGEVNVSFSKTKQDKIFKLENILVKLKKNGVSGNDIVILSNYKLNNEKNCLNELNLKGIYDNIIDLTDPHVRNLNKNIDNIKKTNAIYFSTAAGFQGMESKIIIYIDPLETPINNPSNNDMLKLEKLAFNAMGRANTILYILWSYKFENYYKEKLKIIGSLLLKEKDI